MNKRTLISRGAYATRRAADNSGTFVENEAGDVLGFVPNTESRCGLWLYYADDVRWWLGISVDRGRAAVGHGIGYGL